MKNDVFSPTNDESDLTSMAYLYGEHFAKSQKIPHDEKYGSLTPWYTWRREAGVVREI